jgi:hypothetical protein
VRDVNIHGDPQAERIEEARRRRARIYDPVTGTLHVEIAGAADGAETTPPAGQNTSTGSASGTTSTSTPAATTSLTQADIDKAVNAATTKAKADTKAELDAYLAEQKRVADLAQMEEIDRVKAEKEQADATAAAAQAQLAQRDHDDRVKRALILADVPVEMVDRVRLLVTAGVDADDDTVTADVDKLKAEMPQLFGPAVPATPDGKLPVNRKPGSTPPPSGVEKGRERARAEAEARKGADPMSRFQRVGS